MHGISAAIDAMRTRPREALVPPKNSVRLTLQRLTSFGRIGALHQDTDFSNQERSEAGDSVAGVAEKKSAL